MLCNSFKIAAQAQWKLCLANNDLLFLRMNMKLVGVSITNHKSVEVKTSANV